MVEKKTTKKTATKKVVEEKNIIDEGVEKVKDFATDFATKENAQGLWDRFVSSFQGRDIQDYAFFAIGLILLIRSLNELWEFVWGVVLLLASVLLFNLFFNKK